MNRFLSDKPLSFCYIFLTLTSVSGCFELPRPSARTLADIDYMMLVLAPQISDELEFSAVRKIRWALIKQKVGANEQKASEIGRTIRESLSSEEDEKFRTFFTKKRLIPVTIEEKDVKIQFTGSGGISHREKPVDHKLKFFSYTRYGKASKSKIDLAEETGILNDAQIDIFDLSRLLNNAKEASELVAEDEPELSSVGIVWFSKNDPNGQKIGVATKFYIHSKRGQRNLNQVSRSRLDRWIGMTFPFDRTLIDKNGRPLAARILSIDKNSLQVRRKSDGANFAVPFTSLSEADLAYFGISSLPSKQPGAQKMERTLEDSKGRKLHVTILGRSDEVVKVRRHSDGKQFDIEIENLSATDQEFIKSLD